MSWLGAHLGEGRFFSVGGVYIPNYGSYFGLASLDVNDLPVPKAWSLDVSRYLAPGVSAKIFDGTASDTPALVLSQLTELEAVDVRFVVTPAASRFFGGAAPYAEGSGSPTRTASCRSTRCRRHGPSTRQLAAAAVCSRAISARSSLDARPRRCWSAPSSTFPAGRRPSTGGRPRWLPRRTASTCRRCDCRQARAPSGSPMRRPISTWHLRSPAPGSLCCWRCRCGTVGGRTGGGSTGVPQDRRRRLHRRTRSGATS